MTPVIYHARILTDHEFARFFARPENETELLVDQSEDSEAMERQSHLVYDEHADTRAA